MDAYRHDAALVSVSVRIGRADLERVFNALIFDHRKKGTHGRALARGVEVILLRYCDMDRGQSMIFRSPNSVS